MNSMKELIKQSEKVNRQYFDESLDVYVRQIMRELLDEGIVFVPDYDNGVYRRVMNNNDLTKSEFEHLEKYQIRELKKAISLIQRVRKIQKITKSQRIRNLMGELKLDEQ